MYIGALIVNTFIKSSNSMKKDVITTLLPTLVIKAHQEQWMLQNI